MDVPWDEYKPLLRRGYFGDYEGSIAPRDSDLCRDFWTFHTKYVEMAVKRAVHARDEQTPSTSGYSKNERVNLRFNLDKTSRYTLREVSAREIFEFICNNLPNLRCPPMSSPNSSSS